MNDYSDSNVPRTCALLESLGIDPALTAGDETFTTKSYFQVVLDEDGQMIRNPENPDELALEEHEWPDLATAILVVGTFLEEQREHREEVSNIVELRP